MKRWWWGALLLTGCGRPLDGWWDITSWEVEREELSVRKPDAGWMLLSEFGADLGFSYRFDPILFELIPEEDPEVQSLAISIDNTPEGEADFTMSLEGYFGLEIDVVDFRGSSMTLESLDYWDGTVFRWEMVR